MSRRMNRREILRLSLATMAAGAMGRPIRLYAAGADGREAEFYEKAPGERIVCRLCPRNCVLQHGERCACRTRFNVHGTLRTDAWNIPAIIQIDPVEKSPLHHVLPGTQTLSVGTGGCNLRCLYCQNANITQSRPRDIDHMTFTAEELLDAIGNRQETRLLSFTYNEPVVFYEYMERIARQARDRGLRTNMVTAAYINPAPLKRACQFIDAFTVTLKGFDEAFYRRVVGAKLDPVLRALELIRSEGRWLEVVSLLVPGLNDDEGGLQRMTRWIHDRLGSEVPLHFARFVPAHRLATQPATPLATLERAAAMARDNGLRYVYISNLPGGHRDQNTLCPDCKEPAIRRIGFQVKENRLDAGGRCVCGTRIPGLWS